MMSSYEVKLKLGRFFIAKEKAGYFLGKEMDGYYIALRPSDLIPFQRKPVTTAFWREFWK